MEKQSNETLPQPYEEYKKVLDMKIGEGTSVIHSQIPRQNMFVTLLQSQTGVKPVRLKKDKNKIKT
jgi:hypothetical protein